MVAITNEYIWKGKYRLVLPEGVDPDQLNNDLADRVAAFFDEREVEAIGSSEIEPAGEEVDDGEAVEGQPDQER